MSKSVTVRVPGKVNIYLGVGPREFSGYHELATIFQSLGIYDEVTVSPADTLTITALGSFADRIPTDSTNLAWQAAQLVARACGQDPNINIQIEKNMSSTVARNMNRSMDANMLETICNLVE